MLRLLDTVAVAERPHPCEPRRRLSRHMPQHVQSVIKHGRGGAGVAVSESQHLYNQSLSAE